MATKNKKKIFIPFLDGLLSYDCAKCAYSCCRSGNLIIDFKKNVLLERNPYLRYFFASKKRSFYRTKRYGRCWFLKENGLCGIQTKCGYSAKPFICKLHPFYPLKCCDEYIVVIEDCFALYAGQGNSSINHKCILSNSQKAIAYNHVLDKIDWPKERLELEKEILEASRDFLHDSNYLNFAARQLLMTTKNKDINKIKSDLLKTVDLWKTFLKVNDLNMENKKITYELVVCTSLLRTWSILNRMKLSMVPVALLGLYFYMMLFARVHDSEVYYYSTFTELLHDISAGLLFLKKEDLSLRNASIEDRISCLRLLQSLNISKLMQK